MDAAGSPPVPLTSRPGVGVSHAAVLALLLALEVVVFAVLGTNFLTWINAFEVLRLSVEIGLLALALTPVIVSGGIDLSVGSLMGLSAVPCSRSASRPTGHAMPASPSRGASA